MNDKNEQIEKYTIINKNTDLHLIETSNNDNKDDQSKVIKNINIEKKAQITNNNVKIKSNTRVKKTKPDIDIQTQTKIEEVTNCNIISTIGSGGFSIVKLAENKISKEKVALKIVRFNIITISQSYYINDLL